MRVTKSEPFSSRRAAEKDLEGGYIKIGKNKYLLRGTKDGAKAWVDNENRIVRSYG